MTSKCKSLYVILFKFLRDTFGISPSSTMSDFEKASQNAARETWEDVTIHGCQFHFAKAIRRKALTFPALRRALRWKRGDIRLKRIIKMYQRLSLLPRDRVEDGLEYIRQQIHELHLVQTMAPFNRRVIST